MELLSWPRASGKTRELLTRMTQDPDLIYVAVTERQARDLRIWAEQNHLGIEPWRFQSARSAAEGRLRGVGTRAGLKYAVDELDAVLARLLHGPVEVATYSPEESA